MAKQFKKVPWYKKEISLSFGHVKLVDIVMLTKHMSVMLEAGLTLPESLEVLVDQSIGTLKKVLKRVYKRVNEGGSFAESVEKEPKVFDKVFVSAAYIGESSGTLAENLNRLSIQMEKNAVIRRSIKSALMYPIIVVTITMILGFGVATYVLPQISGIFRSLRVELPLSTRIVMWLANAFDNYGVWISLVSFIIIGTIVWFLRLKFMEPIVHKVVLKIPAFGAFLHDIQRARFCRMLGTLLESGTPISETLEIAHSASTNFVYRRAIKKIHKRVDGGDNFSDAISDYPTLYPSIIQQMVGVGERSGSLGDSLNYLANFYEDKVEASAKNISSLIEPILLVFIGGIVAALAISILTPIYSILGNVNA